ncbi:tyrosine-type recombinase/integrase [Brevundimonas sp.]|uniref:tyrosine-type recombinase/integrase n=1 Tax=Brevundimonas sp. TaxID=1871086 RepID=UPI003F6FAC5C
MVGQQIIQASPLRLRARRETARRSPVLLTSEDIRLLLDEASQLADNPRAPLRGPTFETIFALIAGLGLRISEAANLRCIDVDLEKDVLEIRETKFGKDRLVPIGPRLHARLAGYLELRAARGLPSVGEAPLFSWKGQTPVSTNTIRNVFREKLLPRLQVVAAPGTFGPCVHGLRHAFAVRTLTRWYRQGEDPAARLNHLSTILGHVNPKATAVYLTITADLLQESSRRFEFCAPTVSEG